jgi:hypothetical protein
MNGASMSEMIERVGKVIDAKLRLLGAEFESIDIGLAIARAAIEAMREPTAQMLPAGTLADDGCEMPGHVYRAMIDVALGIQR